MYLIFDTETTGLPQYNKYRGYNNPKLTSFYNSSRVLSISWILLDENAMNITEQQTCTYYIKPDGFRIPSESILIHGITEEVANSKGIPIANVLDAFQEVLPRVTCLVAHNISFDIHVLASECHRDMRHQLAAALQALPRYCTMAEGRKCMGLPKNPKLAELYLNLFGNKLENAHDAKYDTLNCCRCFLALMRLQGRPATKPKQSIAPSLANNANNANNDSRADFPKLDTEQHAVVTGEHIQGNTSATLVVACAGSGKTTTIVHRIHHLVTYAQVPESAIMLTTFSRHAAQNMRRRLANVLNHDPEVLVGTFDSLALHLVRTLVPSIYDLSNIDVSEYSSMFVEFLTTAIGKTFAKTIQHVFVDEFQDINDIQFEIVRLFNQYGASITCVGDDAQSIYGFRDCNVRYMREFDKLFAHARVLNMTTNYRSAPPIIRVANACVNASIDGIKKEMQPIMRGDCFVKPTVTYFFDTKNQNAHILKGVQDLMQRNQCLLKESVAVLCPHNKYLYDLEDMLLRHNIPTVLLDTNTSRSTMTPKSETEDHARGKVCLTTIHKAKGLEWDIVYVIMACNDIFPMHKSPEDIAEGRRLFYVAVTRAKTQLHISFAPTYQNSHHQTQMTQYISELDPELFIFRGGVQPCHFPSLIEQSDATTPKIARQIHRPNIATMLLHPKAIRELRNKDLIPDLPTSSFKVYERVPYLEFITSQDLQAEFTAFVQLFVHRSLCIAYDQEIVAHTSSELLRTVHLDYLENIVYTKYATNFKNSLSIIAAIVKGSNIFKKRGAVIDAFLSQSPGMEMDGEDMSFVLRILRKMEKRTRVLGGLVPFDELVVKRDGQNVQNVQNTSNALVLDCLIDALKKYTNHDTTQDEAIWATWQVAVSNLNLSSARRRNKYTNISLEDLKRYDRLYELITDHFLPLLSTTYDVSSFEFYLPLHSDAHDLTMHAHIIKCKGCTILFDTSCCDGNIALEMKIRLLCAKQLYSEGVQQGVQPGITHIAVFDPLEGELKVMDVRTYASGRQLLSTLFATT